MKYQTKYFDGITDHRTGKTVTTRYRQPANATDEMNRKLNIEHKVKSKGLESCSMCALSTALEQTEWITTEDYPKVYGKEIRLPDFLMSYINEPDHDYSRDPDQMDNRRFKNIAKLANDIFDCGAEWINMSGLTTEHQFKLIVSYLKDRTAVIVCKPGHYVEVGKCDTEKEELYYLDSMKSGVHVMDYDMLSTCHDSIVIIPEKA